MPGRRGRSGRKGVPLHPETPDIERLPIIRQAPKRVITRVVPRTITRNTHQGEQQ